ncbi:MAG: sulfotransferase [Candidatus Omnitrophica bacterium]|nr:sulfotransferase [Candidatus Omnitrophota bacterium]
MDPIFIIGTERSGTNMLRLMLDAHPSICVPHPPHIFKNFYPLLSKYGDLDKEDNLRCLVNDVVRSVELHHYQWPLGIDREKVFSASLGKGLAGVFGAVYDQYLAHTGKKRWACKSTFMIHHVDLMREVYPGAKFIYMVRDGRDVALSARDSIFSDYSVYYSALRWKREQDLGEQLLERLKEDDIILLKYEELIKDTEKELKRISGFIREEFFPGMLKFFNTREAAKSAGISLAWRNTGRPVMSGNSGKFLAGLSEKEIELFETIAGKELRRFGFELVNKDPKARFGPLSLTFFFIEENVRKALVEIKHLFTDKNNVLRFKKSLFLWSIYLKKRKR